MSKKLKLSNEKSDQLSYLSNRLDIRRNIVCRMAIGRSLAMKNSIKDFKTEDNSGFEFSSNEPFAGGYFSPQLFLNNVLLLGFGYQFDNEAVLQLEAGPSFQYANESSDDASWNVGGEAHLSYHMPLAKSLYFNTEGNYFQTSDVYRNYTITAGISYKF